MVLQSLSRCILTLSGWKIISPIGEVPRKYLVIGAPHTSNWDFPIALLACKAMGIQFSWVGKHTLFRGIGGRVMRRLGGIPVNRSTRKSFLAAMVDAFSLNDELLLGIAPEGTRSRKNHWRAGFYHIAVKADVKICLGFIDYPTKSVGFGPFLRVSGDISQDFHSIKDFYSDKRGKISKNKSEIRLRDKEEQLLKRELLS